MKFYENINTIQKTQSKNERRYMKRFWLALFVAIFFYARTDILIWQRIFESHQLWMGIDAYHWGWVNSLFGFMLLGILVSYPSVRRMVAFPIYLGILAFSGFEDILYYWMDGRGLPSLLPWLNDNPMILKPVTSTNLVFSVILWLSFIVLLDWFSARVEKWVTDRELKERMRLQAKAVVYQVFLSIWHVLIRITKILAPEQ